MGEIRTRRRFLRKSGATLAAFSVAGCSTLSTGQSGLVLGDVNVRNPLGKPHTVAVTIYRNKEEIHEGTYDLGAETKETIQATWPDDPAVYDIQATIDGDVELEREATHDDASEETCTICIITTGWENTPPAINLIAPVTPDDPHRNYDCNE